MQDHRRVVAWHGFLRWWMPIACAIVSVKAGLFWEKLERGVAEGGLGLA